MLLEFAWQLDPRSIPKILHPSQAGQIYSTLPYEIDSALCKGRMTYLGRTIKTGDNKYSSVCRPNRAE
jgi:hypothetical protein